jgi:hypothetical protein
MIGEGAKFSQEELKIDPNVQAIKDAFSNSKCNTLIIL